MRDFNFFEPYIEKKKLNNTNQIMLIRVVLGVICVLIVMPIVSQLYMRKIENKASMASSIAQSSEDFQVRKNLEKKKMNTETMRTMLESLKTIESELIARDNISDMLIYTIRDAIPQDLFLTTLAIDINKVEITGKAKSQISIAQLQYNLKKIPFFQEIFIPNITEEQGNFSFTLSFVIKDVNIDEAN